MCSAPSSSAPSPPASSSAVPRPDFYQTLRSRIASWLEARGKGYEHAQILLLAPDLFHLLTRLMLDPRIPAGEKARLGGALAYFVAPIDAIPEALVGPAGYVDDVALAAFALNALINAGHGEVARELWAGEGNLLERIQQILGAADQMLGSGLWTRLRQLWGSFG